MTEAVLQRLILGNVMGDRERFPPDRVWLWRVNVMAAHYGDRFVKSTIRGSADLSGVIVPYGYGESTGVRLEVEVKGDDGKRTKNQITFGNRMLQMGAIYVVAFTLEQALTPIDKILRGEPWR